MAKGEPPSQRGSRRNGEEKRAKAIFSNVCAPCVFFNALTFWRLQSHNSQSSAPFLNAVSGQKLQPPYICLDVHNFKFTILWGF